MLVLGMLLTGSASAQDWPNLAHYRAADLQILDSGQRVKAVFMGDSITDFWIGNDSSFFATNGYIDRGISGQTSPQMLLRFRQDVISLKPEYVVLLCGTNDIAGNTGPSTLEMTEDNIRSMTELARANHIRMILCSVLPANRFYWNPSVQPADSIVMLNSWIRAYAAAQHLPYVDYYRVLADDQQGMKAIYSKDGVHPNAAGYQIMEPLVQKLME